MDRDLTRSLTVLAFLIGMLAVFIIASCEIGITAKVDSHPSKPTTQEVIHGVTDDPCAYTIASDGAITVQSGSCPVEHGGHVLLSHGADGCSYAITQSSKTLIQGTCK